MTLERSFIDSMEETQLADNVSGPLHVCHRAANHVVCPGGVAVARRQRWPTLLHRAPLAARGLTQAVFIYTWSSGRSS